MSQAEPSAEPFAPPEHIGEGRPANIPWLWPATIAWNLLQIGGFIGYALTGRLQEMALASARSELDVEALEVPLEQVAAGFIVINALIVLVGVVIVTLLAWRTQRGSLLARYALSVTALGWIVIEAFSLLGIDDLGMPTIPLDWFLGLSSIAVSLFLMLRPHLARPAGAVATLTRR